MGRAVVEGTAVEGAVVEGAVVEGAVVEERRRRRRRRRGELPPVQAEQVAVGAGEPEIQVVGAGCAGDRQDTLSHVCQPPVPGT